MWWLILQVWISRCQKPLHHWSNALKSSFAKNLDRATVKFRSLTVTALFAKLSWNFHRSLSSCSALAGNQQYITGQYIIEVWPVLMACSSLVPEKIVLSLQCSGTNYRYFIWAKRSTSCTAWRAEMVYSACSIALLLASFHIALPSEREKQDWIDWTIKISTSKRWFLLGWCPKCRLCFQLSHHATYRARRSLTSYRPVVHMRYHFSACVRRHHMPRGTTRAPPEVPQLWLNILRVL